MSNHSQISTTNLLIACFPSFTLNHDWYDCPHMTDVFLAPNNCQSLPKGPDPVHELLL